MTKTTNYQLPKWEKTDRIQMDDFNDAFQKLDAMPRIVFGSYVGDGTDDTPQQITLGQTPRIVYVIRRDGFPCGQGFGSAFLCYGGLCAPNHPCHTGVPETDWSLRTTATGFEVRDTGYYKLNSNNTVYHYLVLF